MSTIIRVKRCKECGRVPSVTESAIGCKHCGIFFITVDSRGMSKVADNWNNEQNKDEGTKTN